MTRRTVTIELASGLEARPIAMLVQLASSYESTIYVQSDNKKVNANLTKEWKSYHQKKTAGSISKLNTLGNLASDLESVSKIRTNIANGSEWNGLSLSDDGVNSRLTLLKKSIDDVDQLEESLNLSDEIRSFIVSVTNRKAKVSDVTDNIIRWIKEEHLENKFVINFKN